MPLERIGDVDLRHVAGATEAAGGSVAACRRRRGSRRCEPAGLRPSRRTTSHGDGDLAAAGPAAGCATAAPAAAPTGAADPEILQFDGIATRVREPCKSPVAEWHELHFAAKYVFPAAASPTTMFSSTGAAAGGEPCPRSVAATLWIYAATAFTSSSEVERRHHRHARVLTAVLARPARSIRRSDR